MRPKSSGRIPRSASGVRRLPQRKRDGKCTIWLTKRKKRQRHWRMRSARSKKHGKKSAWDGVDTVRHFFVEAVTAGRVAYSNSGWRVSDPLPPSAALPLTEGENKSFTLQ